MQDDPGSIVLRPISRIPSGEFVEPLRLGTGGQAVIIGRTGAAGWTVPEMTVSRQHASLQYVNGEWVIGDLGSRHGTWVNGQRLREGEKLPLRPGDQIRLGQWACRCDEGGHTSTRLTTMADAPAGSRVRAIPHTTLGGVAQQRLDALIEASRRLEGASDQGTVARVLVECAAAGTGCRRALLVRPADSESFDVLASTDGGGVPTLSRTLLDAAGAGEVVQLTGDRAGLDVAQSLIDLEIRSAICAPLMIAGAGDSFLYLDTRGSEALLSPDLAAFCSALAQFGSMAIERLLSAEMRERREQLERDLAAARRAQQLLMPPRSGTAHGLSYCFESIPGRYVAGDLFDLLALPDGRSAFFLGDVSGKGIAAGLLMAAAQAHLRTLLTHSVGLARAVTSLNEHVHSRTDSSTFLTLIAGIYDPVARRVEIADAGHGLCCMCAPGRGVERILLSGGIPLGVSAGGGYTTESIEAPAGSRLVLFSDGVVEQTGAEEAQFGIERVIATLAPSTSPETDVANLLGAVRLHAEGAFADDITVVSLATTEGA